MADDDKIEKTTTSLALSEADRALLEQIREQIAERSQIRRTPATRGTDAGPETKRARLERNQQQLEQLFDEAIARPSVARALSDTRYDSAELRQAAAKGTWARDVAPAIAAIQAPGHGDQEMQRRDTVARVAKAMNDLARDQPRTSADRWIDDLEGDVRASFEGRRPSEKQVAERLVMWAEEAMSAVSQPVATAARSMLVHRAFEAELHGEGQSRTRLEPTLRVALTRAGIGPDADVILDAPRDASPADDIKVKQAIHRKDEAAPVEPNYVVASDGAESAPSRRQIADLAEAARDTASTQTTTEQGWVARLRGYWSRNANHMSSDSGQTDDADALPEALRRRYAIHVADDGRTIELFETGAKTATITLNAKSISTPHNEGAVISDIVLLARDRGWQSLKVSGTSEFKDAVWLEGSKAGLAIQHEPSSAVRATFAKWDHERPANQIQEGAVSRGQEPGPRRGDDLAQAFSSKSAEERLADPRLRNAQLELMIGIRTAEKELKRPIAEMPEVARALTAAVREQLAQGRTFDAPFVKADVSKRAPRQVVNPRIEADRIPPPRV